MENNNGSSLELWETPEVICRLGGGGVTIKDNLLGSILER